VVVPERDVAHHDVREALARAAGQRARVLVVAHESATAAVVERPVGVPVLDGQTIEPHTVRAFEDVEGVVCALALAAEVAGQDRRVLAVALSEAPLDTRETTVDREAIGEPEARSAITSRRNVRARCDPDLRVLLRGGIDGALERRERIRPAGAVAFARTVLRHVHDALR